MVSTRIFTEAAGLVESRSCEEQIILVELLFVLIAALGFIVVIWRYLDVQAYCRNRKTLLPFGFGHESDFLPYFILLGACGIFLIGTIIGYTSEVGNKVNRIPIFVVFWDYHFFVFLSTRLAQNRSAYV
ncbi:MAG: hypothetical protein A3G24_02530 [Betaproteobacteria bacterium RIFCSPLOWO2_12_FULL_62_13]|nr:MAG: hypothetical protein A3G24_02530 [Betaproteobacteria bacterium RIFCSPLOWO2_12_FULL_62_13]